MVSKSSVKWYQLTEEQSFALSSQSATERCRRRVMAGRSNLWSPAPRHAAVMVPFLHNSYNSQHSKMIVQNAKLNYQRLFHNVVGRGWERLGEEPDVWGFKLTVFRSCQQKLQLAANFSVESTQLEMQFNSIPNSYSNSNSNSYSNWFQNNSNQ